MNYTYVPKQFRGKENPPTFTLRDLTLRDLAELEDELVTMTDDRKVITRVGSTKLSKFVRSVIGWENVQVHGQPLAFSEENKMLIPQPLYSELVDALNRRLESGEADALD